MESMLAHGMPVDALHPLRHSTALMEASRRGCIELVRWLLEHNASPVLLNGSPLTSAIHVAIICRHWEIAQHLIAAAQTATLLDSQQRTPLHVMCMENFEDTESAVLLPLATQLANAACPLDALDREGATALHYCAINNNAPIAKLLLERGANPNIVTPDNHVSPITIAAMEKNGALVNLFLQYGADPHLEAKTGACAAQMLAHDRY